MKTVRSERESAYSCCAVVVSCRYALSIRNSQQMCQDSGMFFTMYPHMVSYNDDTEYGCYSVYGS